MALTTQPYKGARDFYPEEYRKQRWMFDACEKVLRSYGYERYDAPILEPLELYAAKSGEEIVNDQTYTFEDRGGRKVAIRPEMTPTVSRMVAARRQELAYPLRWYSIPNLWRYERPQRGRLREHWQLNVDMFGVGETLAEEEIISVSVALMQGLGAKPDMYKIRLNDKRFVEYLLGDHLGLDTVQSYSVIKAIDRMHKMPREEFITQVDALCTPSQREDGVVEKLLSILDTKTIEELPESLRDAESLKDLKSILHNLQAEGVKNLVFDPTLMRGFDYYSGVVFEIFDIHPDNNRSMFGGGRYDGLVGLFGVEPVPTVGFGMGDVVLANFLETHNLVPELISEVHVYIAVAGDLLSEAQKVAKELRKEGVNVAVNIGNGKLDKQFKTADKKAIPYVLVVGQKELDSEQFTLKNLKTGVEEKHSIARIASILEDAPAHFMTASNHVLTGSVFAATTAGVLSAWIILPVAFLLHFVLDALPHFGQREQPDVALKRLKWFLPIDASVALTILLTVAIAQPQYWALMVAAGIACASPDLWSVTRFMRFLRTGNTAINSDWFSRFHHSLQWGERLWGAWIELAWFSVFGYILISRL